MLTFKKYFYLLLIIFFLFWCSWSNNLSLNNSMRIVALWDSLTIWYWLDIDESYPSQLEKKLNNNWFTYSIINWWISGNTSKQLLDRIENFDEYKNADIYLLNIWANDWLRKMDLDKMEINIEKIINYLQNNNPEWKIILFWVKLPFLFWFSYSRDFNSRFEKIANKTGIFYYWDFLDWVNWNSKLNLNDWLHPNSEWYDIISTNISNYLIKNNFIWKESL